MSAAKPKPPPPASSLPAPADRFDRQPYLLFGALALAALVFAVFFNGLRSPFIFDDADSILNNPSIRSLKTALTPPTQSGITVGGRPVLNLSFAINYALGKTEPRGFHLGNILIHALCAITLWRVVRKTLLLPFFSERFSRDAAWFSWSIAALWAVHPLQTESVTYVVQRAESLVGLFYLFTLYCFLRYTGNRHAAWLVAGTLACLLGVGCKEVMATAPIIVFLYDRTFVSGSFAAAWRQNRRFHVALAATWIALFALVAVNKGRGGSVGAGEEITWLSYLCTQAFALVHYVQLSLWPVGLTFDYGTEAVKNAAIFVPCGLIVLSALSFTAWALVKKPAVGFLGAWFFVILAPSSSFIPINTQTIAEHRIYLSLAAIVVGITLVARKILGRRSWIFFCILIVPWALATIVRNTTYLDEYAMWTDTTTKAPTNYRAWANLGNYQLQKAKNPARAAVNYEKALERKPNNPESLNGLGQALIKLGRPSEGLALVEKSLATGTENPALNAGAGVAFMDCELYERASLYLFKALNPDPANSTHNYNLANCLMHLGRDREAEQHFLAAMEGKPDDIDAMNNLGTLLRRNGRIDEAIGWLQRALELDPHSSKTHNNLGVAFMAKGQLEQGLQHLREAVRMEPQSFESRANLYQALMHTDHYDEAIGLCEALVKEKPEAELYNNLGALYGQTGQLEKAAGAFQAALQIDANNADARENYRKVRAYLDARSRR